MFGWKMLLGMLLPLLEAVGVAKVNEDENETGKDDIFGQAILFAVRMLRAILAGDTTKLEKMIPQEQRRLVSKESFKLPPTG